MCFNWAILVELGDRMKGIVLASHGQLAEGMVDSLKLFVGNVGQLEYLCLKPGQDMKEFLNLLNNVIDNVDTGEGVIVFCDLLFGTPCNCTASILKNEKNVNRIEVVTGMNLPMILEIIEARKSDFDLKEMIRIGKDGIVDFKQMILNKQ